MKKVIWYLYMWVEEAFPFKRGLLFIFIIIYWVFWKEKKKRSCSEKKGIFLFLNGIHTFCVFKLLTRRSFTSPSRKKFLSNNGLKSNIFKRKMVFSCRTRDVHVLVLKGNIRKLNYLIIVSRRIRLFRVFKCDLLVGAWI